MAKQKKPREPESAATGARTEPSAAARPVTFSVAQYALLNGVFIAFCALLLLLVRVVLRETQGLYFFFGLMVAGFFLVSVFDYAYDRLAAPPSGRGDA